MEFLATRIHNRRWPGFPPIADFGVAPSPQNQAPAVKSA